MKNPYNEIASKWNDARLHLRADEDKILRIFLDSIPENGKILDLGCGTGIPIGKIVSQAGHKIVGIDSSEALLKIASKNLPHAVLECEDVRNAEFKTNYDGVISWDSVFFHLRRTEHKFMLKKIYNALNFGGCLVLTSAGSNHPAFTDKMFEIEFFYDGFPPPKTISMVEEAGLKIIYSGLLEKPDGQRNKGRLVIVAKKVVRK